MAKKTVKASVKKASAKSGNSDRRGRKVFEFVKAVKDMPEGTIGGIVLKAAQKVKSGTVAEITEAAIKAGIKDVTGQDPLVQTGVWLNRLKAKGAVRKVKTDAKAKAAAGKKVFRLKKSA